MQPSLSAPSPLSVTSFLLAGLPAVVGDLLTTAQGAVARLRFVDAGGDGGEGPSSAAFERRQAMLSAMRCW